MRLNAGLRWAHSTCFCLCRIEWTHCFQIETPYLIIGEWVVHLAWSARTSYSLLYVTPYVSTVTTVRHADQRHLLRDTAHRCVRLVIPSVHGRSQWVSRWVPIVWLYMGRFTSSNYAQMKLNNHNHECFSVISVNYSVCYYPAYVSERKRSCKTMVRVKVDIDVQL